MTLTKRMLLAVKHTGYIALMETVVPTYACESGLAIKSSN